MLTFLDHFAYELLCSVQPADTKLKISSKAMARLNEMAIGDYIYITLGYNDKYEIVKYVHNNKLTGNEIVVERDVERKGAKNFPRGSCVKVEWTKRTMDEYNARSDIPL